MRYFILISHLKLQNANAISSPYTIGFPAMTAWLGGVHALQRKLQAYGYKDTSLDRVAISCHDFDLRVYKGKGDYINSIIGTANPLDKDGTRSAFIEEARCHLEVSLLIECLNFNLEPSDYEIFKSNLIQLIFGMKFASGDILDVKNCEIIKFDDYGDHEQSYKKIIRNLMLGYVLTERHDLLQKAMQEGQRDALDALLDYIKITHSATQDDSGNVTWHSSRKESGWLVPIAVGFKAISKLGYANNQRDNAILNCCFAESVITMGEFVMPYRIKQIDDMLWRYHVDPENSLYLCCNQMDYNKSL